MLALFQRGQPVLNSQFDNSRKIRDMQFLHHPTAIGIYGLWGQMQHHPDLGARVAVGDQLEDLALALTQAAQGADGAAVTDTLRDDLGDPAGSSSDAPSGRSARLRSLPGSPTPSGGTRAHRPPGREIHAVSLRASTGS